MAKEETQDLGLSLDNLIDGDDLSEALFGDALDVETNTEEKNDGTEEEEPKEKNNPAEVDPDTLWEEPENVGSDEETKETKGAEEGTPPSNEGSSSSPDFFSSIATAFAEEGIFPDLSEEDIKNVKSAQDFRKLINDQIQAGLTEEQKRISSLMNEGMQPSAIQRYEQSIAYLNTLDDEIIKEGEEADTLRKRVIYQDLIDKGFKPEKAARTVDRIFDEGTEIDEAKDALQSIKENTQNAYKNEIALAKQAAEAEKADRARRAKKIEDLICDPKQQLFSDVEISKEVRKKAFDNISNPIYKDPDTGEYLTALQKAEKENGEEFIAKLGLLYTLTDGFKTIDKLVERKAKKEIKKGFAELERKINNTARDSFGNLDFASGTRDDNAFIRKGVQLDI